MRKERKMVGNSSGSGQTQSRKQLRKEKKVAKKERIRHHFKNDIQSQTSINYRGAVKQNLNKPLKKDIKTV
jgi:hypothetical protein